MFPIVCSKARKIAGVTVAEWVVIREMLEGGDIISPSQIADIT